jgi:hypothetical protein
MPRPRSIALWLALGATTTIAIAWLFTRELDRRSLPATIGQGPTFDPRTGNQTGNLLVFRYEAIGRTEMQGDTMGYAFEGTPEQPIQTLEEVCPRWAREKITPRDHGGHSSTPESEVYRSLMATGWPMRALWCPYTLEPIPSGVWPRRAHSAIILSRATAATRPGRLSARDDALPILPLWPGFAVDTAVFGGLWTVLLFAPGAARRAIRRRRGRCATCGYDLRSLSQMSACPECGGSPRSV